MLAVDRPGSGDREVPAVPDTSRPEGGESRPDRDAVLTDARLRQEYALAYRAKVDALYGRAEPENVLPSAIPPVRIIEEYDQVLKYASPEEL
jgi:hypothetical protein